MTQQQMLENVAGCQRHYEGFVQGGILGGPGFTGKVEITCDPNTSSEVPNSP